MQAGGDLGDDVTGARDGWAAAAEADQEWFEALFRSHYAALCGYVHRYVGSRDAAKDVVQDVLFSVWRDRRRWAATGVGLVPMLYTSARHHALNCVKRARIGDRSSLRADWVRRTAEPADEALCFGELRTALEQAVGDLPERRRLIFTLSRGSGLTYDEIAASLGLSVKTVETQMGRALKAIRTRLAAHLITGTLVATAPTGQGEGAPTGRW